MVVGLGSGGARLDGVVGGGVGLSRIQMSGMGRMGWGFVGVGMGLDWVGVQVRYDCIWSR